VCVGQTAEQAVEQLTGEYRDELEHISDTVPHDRQEIETNDGVYYIRWQDVYCRPPQNRRAVRPTAFHIPGLAADIAAPEGTPILAAADGTVTVANALDSWGGSYGYYIQIDHKAAAFT